MFLMWLGEQITERGLGNGISILIFAGIAPACPARSAAFRTGAHRCDEHHRAALFIIAVVVLVTFAVVFVERGQRKILVNYAKRRSATRSTAGSRRTCR
jgi:preprotein translocase subunit SecY